MTMLNVGEINAGLAVVGGVSGLSLLTYFAVMIYYARQKEQHIQELRVQVARIEGFMLGKSKKRMEP